MNEVINVAYPLPQPVVSEVPFQERDDFDWRLLNKKPAILIRHILPGTSAATAGNYGVFFIAPIPCQILSVREVHETAGSDAGAVTLQIEKLTGTQALDAGANVLASAIDLKGTANTVVTGTLTTTYADRILAQGDRLALRDSGTLTAVAGVCVMIEIQPRDASVERQV